MRALRSLALAFVLAAACKSTPNDGYTIDFRLSFDGSVTDAALAQITTLHLDVTGAETFKTDISVSGKLAGRSGGLRYKPGATSGMLAFHFSVLGASGLVAEGNATVALAPGTQVVDVTLSAASSSDAGMPTDGGALDMALCGNGKLDPGEACDPGAGSPTPCPTSMADCDDQNDCTTDSFSGSASDCSAVCAHTPLTNGIACSIGGDGGATGTCVAGSCCKGCVVNGVCVSGATDATKCGTGGNACVDCTQFSAAAMCNTGLCSGCDSTSCTTEGRLCGSSSCGYNCGSCADSCMNGGTLTHYTCLNKTCAPVNPPSNCGLYVTCASTTTCSTQCTGDNECVSSAFCDPSSKTCKPKSGLGGPCSAEITGDHECASPYVCSWKSDGTSGYCTTVRCTQCTAATAAGDCSAFMNFGVDPRTYCPHNDPICEQGCNGGANVCDKGLASDGGPRSCGTSSCKKGMAGYLSGSDYLSGFLCVGGKCTDTDISCSNPSAGICADCNTTLTRCDYVDHYSCQ